MQSKYSKAYTEVLEIISYFPEEEYKKIPEDEIKKFKEHMDKDYVFKIDPEKEISEQNISKEANAIIVKLFQDYFATDKQKVILNNLLNQNQEKKDQEVREKYDLDNIFTKNSKTKKEIEIQTEETRLVEYKENFFTKLKNFILNFFNKNK